jgi:two-component system, OmpR family, response regulator
MAATRQQQRILVVDDEPQVRILLRECFELEGFEVGEADSAEAALAALERNPSHLVTLDLNLGGDDGLALARRIRATCNVPIVMITGKGDIIDRVVGLELGADDYISKPFHLREVLARVKAVLRRYEAVSPAPQTTSAMNGRDAYSFASWTLDLPSRELRSSEGASIELTTAEFNMLAVFVERPHRVLSRDNIMDLLKGHEWSPFDRSIDALIVRLRRKIEAEPDTPRLIKTVRGVGYVFAVDVRRG